MKPCLAREIKGYIMRVIFLVSIMLLFSGCLNVNLKSVLPNQTYYSLDNVALENKETKCKDSNSLVLNINVLSPYDGKDILAYCNDSSIKILESYKWIDLPKNMIRNAFLKIGANHCIKVEQNPSVTQKIKVLRVNVINMYVKSNGDNDNVANVYLSYELLNSDLNRQKSDAIVSNANDANPAKALQEAMTKALDDMVSSIKN